MKAPDTVSKYIWFSFHCLYNNYTILSDKSQELFYDAMVKIAVAAKLKYATRTNVACSAVLNVISDFLSFIYWVSIIYYLVR